MINDLGIRYVRFPINEFIIGILGKINSLLGISNMPASQQHNSAASRASKTESGKSVFIHFPPLLQPALADCMIQF
jgi:hypothetical protein